MVFGILTYHSQVFMLTDNEEPYNVINQLLALHKGKSIQ